MITETATTTEFTYVGDAMCSWCWGFSSTIAQLEERFTIPIRFINGGLRPGPNGQTLDDGFRSYLRQTWEHVGQASGQPFDLEALETRNANWVYDTELPAIAIVAMRKLDEHQVLAFYRRLQQAFYAEGIDITDGAVYPELVKEFDVDPDSFEQLMGAADTRLLTYEEFEEARALGITGFPALLLRTGEELATVTKGFAPFDRIEQPLVEYLNRKLGETLVEGLVCEIGGDC